MGKAVYLTEEQTRHLKKVIDGYTEVSREELTNLFLAQDDRDAFEHEIKLNQAILTAIEHGDDLVVCDYCTGEFPEKFSQIIEASQAVVCPVCKEDHQANVDFVDD